VNGDFSFKPKLMEILPDSNFLRNELGPVITELIIVFRGNRIVVTARTDHIEKRSNAVEGTPYKQNTPFSSEFSFSVSLRIVSFNNPDALVYQAFSSKSHVHQSDIELLRNITVRASSKPHNLF
jgi:hypothetical protein